MNEFNDWLSVSDVAEVLGLEDWQVRRSILRQVKAEDKMWVARGWWIRREALATVEMPTPGRPKNTAIKLL